MTGATPNTPQITVNGVNCHGIQHAGSGKSLFTGSITVSALHSALNCPWPACQ